MVTSSLSMADTIDSVAERLARLEVTVAKGFHNSEQQILALSRKVDIQVEAIRADLQSTAEALNGFAEESRRTTDSIRKEHAADRAVMTAVLQQHAARLNDLENR